MYLYVFFHQDQFVFLWVFRITYFLWFGCQYQFTSSSGWLERLASEMNHNVLTGTLNFTHLFRGVDTGWEVRVRFDPQKCYILSFKTVVG